MASRNTSFPDLGINSVFYILATGFGYTLNYYWSFKSNSRHSRAGLKYLAVAATGTGLNFIAVAFMTAQSGLAVETAALVFAALWPIASFAAQKFFVYA